jgi:hypothetical protein
MVYVPPIVSSRRCAICNSRLKEGFSVYSRWTGNRYCLDDKKHERIAAKRRKQQTQEVVA